MKKGTKHSTETRSKIAAAARISRVGRRHSPVTRAKIAAAHRGRQATTEARVNMSVAQKRRMTRPEERGRIKAALVKHRLPGEHICPICLVGFAALARDHDHVTGKLRGRICEGCNLALGGFHDRPVSLLRAAEYLSMWAGEGAQT